jgi:oligo-1,6-glucosidase
VDGPVCDGVYGSLAGEVFNGPHLHEYLQEMNREVLSKYDIMTVGECGGTGPKEARQIANAKGTELGMIFQFEHVDLDCGEHGKWSTKKISLPALKKNLSRWQKDLDEMAWNSLYFCNHDQPRVVSRLGDNSPVSAKAIAVAIYSLQGTPYLYQGEELGMTNYPFKRIDDFNDIESIGAFRQLGSTGSFKPEELFEAIAYKSRDNARTPMQWSDEDYAGFTTGTPWFHVNPNYKTINAEAQVKDPDSVFSFYKKYIALRTKSKWKDVLVYGKYQLLAPEDESVFAYLRYDENHTLLVVSNLSPKMREFELAPEEWKAEIPSEEGKSALAQEAFEEAGQCLIGTYPDTRFARKLTLRPWEAFIQVIR